MNQGVGTRKTTRLHRLLVRAMAALVLAAVVILPLVFVPSLDDGYALPKVLVLRALGLAGAILFLGYVLVWGPLTAKSDRRIDLPLACFAGLLLAASLASVDRVQSFAGEAYQYQGLVTVLLYIGSFYVARLSLGSSSGFRAILTTTVCVGAVVSVYGIAQAIGFDPFWSGPPDNRVISSVGQPNDLAAYLDLVVIATVGLRPKASNRVRLALDAVLVVTLVALALTFSRGGYLALVAAVCVLAIPRLRAPRRRWAAIGVTGAALVLATTLAVPTARAFVERVADRALATGDLREGSIRFHLDQWRVGIQVAVEHPLLGTGPETFPLVFRPYLDQVLPPDRAQLLGRFRLESPHNELIAVAAEMGLPALIAYAAFLVSCAATCVRRARESEGDTGRLALVVLAILVTHVVTTFFMTPEVSTSEIFWIAMGAGLAATAPETRLRQD